MRAMPSIKRHSDFPNACTIAAPATDTFAGAGRLFRLDEADGALMILTE